MNRDSARTISYLWLVRGCGWILVVFDLVTSVWRPENLARGTPAREVRRLEDVSMVPSFRPRMQVQKLLL